jgi:hypothetical protein
VVGLGVVGEHALDDDALLAVPGARSREEAGARLGVLAGQELGVSEARVVVDSDVEVLPAHTPVAVWPSKARTEHTLARFPEAAEAFGVDVQELARRLALVAAGAAGRGSLRSRQA